MKVLVTGSNGQLGRSLQDALQSENAKNFIFKNTEALDVTNVKQVEDFFQKNKINYVINCAAYTNVELAEEEEKQAYLVNAFAVKNLAEQCLQHNVTLIHISTDYVFDGKKNMPYLETDTTNPINIYGKSKLKGEQYIQDILTQYFIVRTSWLYSKKHGNNFFKFIKGALDQDKALKILDNQFGSPTNTKDLAEVLLKIIRARNENYGLYHYTGKGITNWFEYAKAIAAIYNPGKSHLITPTNNYPTKAKRATYTKLDTSKAEKNLSIAIPNWLKTLKE